MRTDRSNTDPSASDARATSRELGGLCVWGLGASLVALFHNRLWATPNLSTFSLIAESLGNRPNFPNHPAPDYLLTNLSMPTLARLLGQTADHEYARLHLIVAVLGIGLCCLLAYQRFDYTAARTLLVLVAVSPGLTTIMQWLGQPDALFFPVALATALVRKRISLVALVLLAGVTHPEQAMVMIFFAVAARGALRMVEANPGDSGRARDLVVDAGVAAIGVALARLVVQIYLWAGEITLINSRSKYVGLGLGTFWKHHTQSPWQLIYLLWGPLWLVIVAMAAVRGTRSRSSIDWKLHMPGISSSWLVLGLMASLLWLPVALTLDETRVHAMLGAPLLAAGAVLISTEFKGVDKTRLTVASGLLLIFALVVPGGFTAGIASWSPDFRLSEFVPFLISGEHPGPVDLWLLSPFRYVIPT